MSETSGQKEFPKHWGEPPKAQTRDLRPLPGGFGMGSSTLATWIQTKLDADADDSTDASKASVFADICVVGASNARRTVEALSPSSLNSFTLSCVCVCVCACEQSVSQLTIETKKEGDGETFPQVRTVNCSRCILARSSSHPCSSYLTER